MSEPTKPDGVQPPETPVEVVKPDAWLDAIPREFAEGPAAPEPEPTLESLHLELLSQRDLVNALCQGILELKEWKDKVARNVPEVRP